MWSVIDAWNMQPTWLKRMRLFFGILWRHYEGQRMSWALSWEVACCMYPMKGIDNEEQTDG